MSERATDNYCYEHNMGSCNIKCYFFEFDKGNATNKIKIGHCSRLNKSFAIPKDGSELIDGKYIINEECPDRKGEQNK